MFPLPVARTYEAGLPPEARIPGFRDNVVPVSCGTCMDIVYSSIPQYGLEELIPVLGYYTGTSRYIGRPEGLEYGPRPRTGPTGWDIRDLGACLRHHTTG